MRALNVSELELVSGGDGDYEYPLDEGFSDDSLAFSIGAVGQELLPPDSQGTTVTTGPDGEIVVTMHKPTDGDIGIELIEVGGGLILLGAIGLGVAATGGSALPLATAGIVTASTLIGAGGAALAAQGLSMLPHGTRAQP